MHEASLAQVILECALQEAASRAARRICQLRLRVGVAANVEVESLRFAIEHLACGGPAEGVQVDIEDVALTVDCRSCGLRSEPPAWSYRCAGCGGADVDVVGGHELQLVELDLDLAEA
ncbi:MAG: hydrogenase maturation nickel metallochaperone HypA [Pseudomonadota bacterium]